MTVNYAINGVSWSAIFRVSQRNTRYRIYRRDVPIDFVVKRNDKRFEIVSTGDSAKTLKAAVHRIAEMSK